MGALDEAAMLVARADDTEAARAEVGATLDVDCSRAWLESNRR